jgi:hypothetical protein
MLMLITTGVDQHFAFCCTTVPMESALEKAQQLGFVELPGLTRSTPHPSSPAAWPPVSESQTPANQIRKREPPPEFKPLIGRTSPNARRAESQKLV